MISAVVTGYLFSLSLILAIGPQNTFVLRQGLLKSHVFPICLFCAVSDALLITLGVAGFDRIIDNVPALPLILTLTGVGFLSVYGVLRFRAAFRGKYEMEIQGKGLTLWPALSMVVAFTWLNPAVYLDTVGLIGAVSTQFTAPAHKIAFALAATVASFTFFFSLGYGARLLAPIMHTTRTWRILDVAIGCTMFLVAGGLALSLT